MTTNNNQVPSEKLSKLINLTHLISQTGADAFLCYYGHIATIDVGIHTTGWIKDKEYDHAITIPLDRGTLGCAKNEMNLDDAILFLQKMYDELTAEKTV